MSHTIHPHLFQSLLHCLRTSKGKLVGGIVRNFVMGLLKCNDIDIWFKSNEDKHLFIQMFKCEHDFTIDNTSDIHEDGFDKSVGYWKINDSTLQIELMVCEQFPMGDFSFNLLSYDGDKVQSESSQYTTSEVISHIFSKSGYILKSNPRNIYKYIEYGYILNNIT